MKARATEINIWDGNLKERFTAAADVPSWVSPGLMCKVTDVLGMGQCWRKELVSLSQICSWRWATLRCPWSIPDLLQLWLWCWCFKDDYAIPHLYFLNLSYCKKPQPRPGSTNTILIDWLTPYCLTWFTHITWSCLTSVSSFEPYFRWVCLLLGFLVLCQTPCPGVSGSTCAALRGDFPVSLLWLEESPGCQQLLEHPLHKDRAPTWSPQPKLDSGFTGGKCCCSCFVYRKPTSWQLLRVWLKVTVLIFEITW